MTSLSPPPPAAYHSRSLRLQAHRLPSPPVAFSSSPARRSRADSPSPMTLQPRTHQSRARRDVDSSDGDDEFPPSISQRRVSSRPQARTPKVEKGRLMLPAESDHALKEKRSFERTRQWAEEAERLRRANSADERFEENEGSMEGLVSDRSIDGSSASPIPPRTPSPVPSSRSPPQVTLTLSEKQKPILSIDEIIRLHSGSAQTAFAAATDKARRELGLAPSPHVKKAEEAKLSPPQLTPAGKKLSSPPPIPTRTSSSPIAKVHIIPSRSSSIRSPVSDRSASPARTPIINTILNNVSIYPTPPPTQPKVSLGPTPSNHSSGTIPRSPVVESPTPSRPPTVRSSTAPPSIHPDQTHEMALHLRSAELNKFLTFPRPYPDRPLRVSYAEVGKPDGMPVLFFLGVGCVRYLMAMYDQLALVYGLRLICVDRWGYGKTDQVDQVDRGLIEWSGVIAQVLAKLKITKFQVVAHSAGTPYAMAVARRYPEKIRGRLHLLAPWVGQDHDTGMSSLTPRLMIVSKWLKWVPGGVIRTATAADHRLQTYFLGKAPRLQYAPIAFNANVIPPMSTSTSGNTEMSVEELDETKSTKLIRRASTVFSSKPRSRSIYGTAASASTLNLSLPTLATPGTLRRAGSTRSPTPSLEKDTLSVLGRSPGLKNLAAMRSAKRLASADSGGTSSTAPSTDMLVTPDTSMAISASELDFGLGEGFGSFATDLGLAMPVLENMSKEEQRAAGLGSESSGTMSRSTSGASEAPIPTTQATPTSLPSSPAIPKPTPGLPASRFPTDAAFSTALTQASHAECEPGTTSDILRVILNKPYRPWGFKYEDVPAASHVWIGGEDRIISKESIKWMEEVCGSTVEHREGEGHNLMSSPSVLCDLFKYLGEEARAGRRKEEKEERERVEAVEKERAERWRAEGKHRMRGW